MSLHLHTIFNYTKATLSSRNMIEGQHIINSGLIMMCGVTDKCNEKIEIYSLCLQTSVLTSEPHEITGTLLVNSLNNNSGEESFVNIDKMNCSCKAGTSHSCKHIVAVLLYCNRNDVTMLDYVSSTDKKCTWRKYKEPILEQFEARPLKTFCCVKQDRIPALAPNVLVAMRDRLIKCDAETAIAKHRNRNINKISFLDTQNETICNIPINFSPVNSNKENIVPQNAINNNVSSQLQSDAQDFLRLIVDNASKSDILPLLNSIIISMDTCCKNTYNSKIVCNDVLQKVIVTMGCVSDWKKERKFRITGSRCYSIYTYAKDNWPEKARKYFWAKEFKNKFTSHGNKYEPVAREVYITETGQHVQECGIIISKSEPWAAYSPDGIIIKNSAAVRLLEIKCPFNLHDTKEETLLKKCKFLRVERNSLTLKKKHQYYAQIQFGMALLNLKQCDFVIYSNISNSIKIINVNYDKEYVESLFVTLKKNYFEKMLHEICLNARV